MIKQPITGVLLVNLGTPTEPTTKSVRKYLQEFLSDPAIVSIPRPIWWFILNFIVLQIRPQKSAKLYKHIWTEKGSPLLFHSVEILQKLRERYLTQAEFKFALGMRYGEPSLSSALSDLKKEKIERLIVLPLYPQYSETTVGSADKKIKAILQQMHWEIPTTCIKGYHDYPRYIEVIAHDIAQSTRGAPQQSKILFSYHGLPQRSVKNGDPYFEQCQQTSRLIAEKLQLQESKWEMVFQSRFGREKWLQPYCHEVLQSLPQQGIKSVQVICPGFPVDCLETLEEIAITNKRLFLDSGGTSFAYIPAPNASDAHIEMLSQLIVEETASSEQELDHASSAPKADST